MRTIIFPFILLLLYSAPVLSQSATPNRLSHRFSVVGAGLYGTGRNVGEITTGSVSRNTIPGATAAFEYSLQFKGITGTLGVGMQILPAGGKYHLPQEFFLTSEEWDDFEGRLAQYSVPLTFVPAKLGYTFKRHNKWQASLSAGMNFYRQYSYSVSYNRSYNDAGYGRLPVSRFVVRSPSSGPRQVMKTYNATFRLARVLPNSSELLVGIVSNFSNETLYTGSFSAAYANGTQTADYHDNGSFLGLQFGYTFPVRKEGRNQ
ncbi:hypothetical protein [Daejeonella lutea]|uniref:Outer membrane protein beta-barrel domain-containing protein n=1 Tax=Daejeonella lutea TaxID=572036 RepID=A0A1T5B1F2_9SPHI|nr:hypothetical protein [Daejeonella lutea]SKB41076.1 hypothetical protein SAMN05661099_1199 [Daejeonella lutea]